jgi:hypothetical protein
MGWTFAHHPHLLIGIHLDSDRRHRVAAQHAIRDLSHISYWNGVHYNENSSKLVVMSALFAIACAHFVAEIVIWLILLAR